MTKVWDFAPQEPCCQVCKQPEQKWRRRRRRRQRWCLMGQVAPQRTGGAVVGLVGL